MIRSLGTIIQPLTRQLAKRFSTMATWRGERPFKNERAKELRTKLDSGLFYDPEWSRAIWNGTEYRMNGQHSSVMLDSLEDGEFPNNLNVSIKTFECDSELDMCLLFSQFDRVGGVRVYSEQVKACSSVHEECSEINGYTMIKALAGIAFSIRRNNESAHFIGPVEKASLVHDNIHFLVWYSNMNFSAILERAPIVAAIFDTFMIERDEAERFWKLVNDQSHPDKEHPTRILSNFILTSIVQSKKGVSGKNGRWSPAAFYVKCICAWNAYCKGAVTRLNFVSKAKNKIKPIRPNGK